MPSLLYTMDFDGRRDNSISKLNEIILSVTKFSTQAGTLHGMAEYYCSKLEKKVLRSTISSNIKSAISLVLFNIVQFFKEKEQFINDRLKKSFDQYPPFQVQKCFIAGSLAEGLFLYYNFISDTSDIDYMCELKNIRFSKEDQQFGDLAVHDNTPFVDAYLTDVESLKIWKDFFEEPASEALKGNVCRLSARKLKERLFENCLVLSALDPQNEEYNLDGESPSLEVTEARDNYCQSKGIAGLWNFLNDSVRLAVIPKRDIVLSIVCDGWPQNAYEWIHRRRNWPPNDVVEEISKGGFHIVAKSSHEGKFRLSFSKAEISLVKSMNKLQYKVFRAFKAVYKFLIVPKIPNAKNVFSWYYLKTIVFWYVENSPRDSWTKENVVVHLLSLFDKLVEACEKQFLSMYFIPKYNLLRNLSYDKEELQSVVKNLAQLSKNISDIQDAVNNVVLFRYAAITELDLSNL